MSTTPSSADERELFESVAEGFTFHCAGGNEYINAATRNAYEGFKLGRASLGAAQVPAGFALVPLRLTRAMDEVMQVEGWQWSDLLAAAESITSEQYDEISRAPEALAGAAQVPSLSDMRKLIAGYFEEKRDVEAATNLLADFHRLMSGGAAALSQPSQQETK